MDTNVIVAENEKTRLKELRKINQMINDVGGDVAGVVLNKVNNKGEKYYYYMNKEKSLNIINNT